MTAITPESSYSQKSLKQKARQTIRKHYFLLLILVLLASLLGTNFTDMLNVFELDPDSEIGITTSNVIDSILEGDINGALDAAAVNTESLQSGQSLRIGGLELGHAAGVFADLVNAYSSGSIFASVASVVLNFTGSPSLTSSICMILALLFIGAEVIFISRTYRIVYTRLILEGRTYEKVSSSSLFFLIRIKRWVRVSLAYLRCGVRQFLWNLTIVGGIIKHYSYAMVKYILAENPTISGKDAIALSRRMMQGHKWELFCLELSFLGWDILSGLTGGLVKIFYAASYKVTSYAEYYVYIRQLAHEQAIPGSELLNDTWLFEKAPSEEIDRAYWDVLDAMTKPDMELSQPSKLRRFFQDVFGVVVWYDSQELEYRRDMTAKARDEVYEAAIDGRSYPTRLCPIKAADKRGHLEHTLYMRHYSLTSLILIFFSFCLVGWLWEVSIHLVSDGVFVNRGVLHGPWLPIYGTGALLILLILNKLRKNPAIEFLAAILLCGAVEYFGSWMLEKLHNGTKWWDYTGYFLNINGRICAEGLLVFGLAGVAAVYFIAPLLDNFFSRMREQVKIAVCAALLVIFACDLVYSHFVPNTGAGITDYGQTAETVTYDPNSQIDAG